MNKHLAQIMDRKAAHMGYTKRAKKKVHSTGEFLFADPVEKSLAREDINVGDKVCYFRSSDVCNGKVLMNGIVTFVPKSRRFFTVDVGYYKTSVPGYRVHKGWSNVGGGYDNWAAENEMHDRNAIFEHFSSKEVEEAKRKMFSTADYTADSKVSQVAAQRMSIDFKEDAQPQ